MAPSDHMPWQVDRMRSPSPFSRAVAQVFIATFRMEKNSPHTNRLMASQGTVGASMGSKKQGAVMNSDKMVVWRMPYLRISQAPSKLASVTPIGRQNSNSPSCAASSPNLVLM